MGRSAAGAAMGMDHQVQYMSKNVLRFPTCEAKSPMRSKTLPLLATGEFDLSGFFLYRLDGSKSNGKKPVPCRKAMKLLLALQLACLSLITTNALFAEEPLAISSLLKVPGDYHLQAVTLEGSIQDMEPVQQYRSMGRECASVRFRLEDKTGSIQVLVPAPVGILD